VIAGCPRVLSKTSKRDIDLVNASTRIVVVGDAAGVANGLATFVLSKSLLLGLWDRWWVASVGRRADVGNSKEVNATREKGGVGDVRGVAVRRMMDC
jgi:hypothetical protein